MFRIGDTVFHPNYGAGVVTEIKELAFLGNAKKRYYSIELLGQSETTIMVAVQNEDRIGLRSAIPASKLSQVWHILRTDPEALPNDHKERYAVLKDKLRSGDLFRIAEAVRDLTWRKEEKRHLTTEGKRLYERGIELLVGEVAGAQGSDFATAETQVLDRLAASAASAVM
jgi:CarD family transcriptional regulator